MTILDFIALDDEQQATVLDQGSVLASREENNYKIFLYKMPHFFVEVYFNKTYNLIQTIRPFQTSALLKQYFDSRLN
jgi:hypothetical protein